MMKETKESADPLQVLREALTVSPDNVPLRRYLAESLLAKGRVLEAEREFREALRLSPDEDALKLGLARAFTRQSKESAALVIVEDLIKHSRNPAQAHRLHAEILFESGRSSEAARSYQRALEEDPDLADEELARKLGLAGHLAGHLRAWSSGGEDGDGEESGRSADLASARPKISFADVGGLDSIKEEIRLRIVYPLTHREVYEAYRRKPGGSALLYGPPGCGKTEIALATAGEISGSFLAVGIHDVLDMWLGQSEGNLHDIFDQARDSAPCVLFIDEFDALGANRADLRSSGSRHVISQFLAELDGIHAANEGVFVLAATNAPWHLDPAFRRPGRFDRLLYVPPPDEEARARIVEIHCREKPAGKIEHARVARETEGFSGADLKALVDAAIENKIRAAIRTRDIRALTTRDLLEAIPKIQSTTREWMALARQNGYPLA